MSLSDEDTDLDVNLLLQCLSEDTDDVFCIRINNIKIDTQVLYAIFEALKTTKKICHLSLAGLNINDERGLVRISANLIGRLFEGYQMSK